MDIKKFKRLPILGILRGIDLESIEPIAEVLPAGIWQSIFHKARAPLLSEQMSSGKNGWKKEITAV